MNKIKVLFVCIHNSARSQMAEAFLKIHGKNKFTVESAGLEPGSLNPNVIAVMLEKILIFLITKLIVFFPILGKVELIIM